MSKKFKDPRGGHVRIYWSMLDSPAWRALTHSERAIYVACRWKLTSNNNGNLAFTLAGLREQGLTVSSSTLASGLRVLQLVGIIAVTREGGKVNRGQALATLWRFTDEPAHQYIKLDIPATKPTNEWLRFGGGLTPRTPLPATKPTNEWLRFANVNEVTTMLQNLNARAANRVAKKRADAKIAPTTNATQSGIKKKSPTRQSKRDGSTVNTGAVRLSNFIQSSGFDSRTPMHYCHV